MNAGLIGGIVGGIIGVAGGMIGTYFSIRNTKGPKERSVMVKASVIFYEQEVATDTTRRGKIRRCTGH